MCADVAIHDTDGHNPHAHIMLTVRPLDERGKWQYKTEKEYLCVKNGEELGFTAAEFQQAHSDGWEKQYQYKAESRLIELENMQIKYLEEFEALKGEYTELKGDVPAETLSEIQNVSEQKAIEKIRSAYRGRTDYSLIERCRNEVDDALGEVREKKSIAEKLIRNKAEHRRGNYRKKEIEI